MGDRGRFDELGDDPDRLAGFDVRALDGRHDDELQAVVAAAATTTGAPIAAVSLVLHHIQFFRAHVGLPPGLAITRATDRCVSFCQVVVRTRVPLEINEARGDLRVPQTLVERYGVRAYYGTPVWVHGVILGTLCVLDVIPREFSETARAEVDRLAVVAARRLTELLRSVRPVGAAPSLHRPWRGDLMGAIASLASARASVSEAAPMLRALAGVAHEDAAAPILDDAAAILLELGGTLHAVEVSLRKLFADLAPN